MSGPKDAEHEAEACEREIEVRTSICVLILAAAARMSDRHTAVTCDVPAEASPRVSAFLTRDGEWHEAIHKVGYALSPQEVASVVMSWEHAPG
jgi:hypothetical protein